MSTGSVLRDTTLRRCRVSVVMLHIAAVELPRHVKCWECCPASLVWLLPALPTLLFNVRTSSTDYQFVHLRCSASVLPAQP